MPASMAATSDGLRDCLRSMPVASPAKVGCDTRIGRMVTDIVVTPHSPARQGAIARPGRHVLRTAAPAIIASSPIIRIHHKFVDLMGGIHVGDRDESTTRRCHYGRPVMDQPEWRDAKPRPG